MGSKLIVILTKFSGTLFSNKRTNYAFNTVFFGVPFERYYLVGGFNPLKNISQIGSFAQVGVNIQKYLSCHHLAKIC